MFHRPTGFPMAQHFRAVGAVVLYCLLCGGQTTVASSVFTTNALFSDGAVFQRRQARSQNPAPPNTIIHGKAEPGATVSLNSTGTITFPGAPYATTADSTGIWEIKLQPLSATTKGQSYDLELTSGSGR